MATSLLLMCMMMVIKYTLVLDVDVVRHARIDKCVGLAPLYN